jgi:hypothetical protein
VHIPNNITRACQFRLDLRDPKTAFVFSPWRNQSKAPRYCSSYTRSFRTRSSRIHRPDGAHHQAPKSESQLNRFIHKAILQSDNASSHFEPRSVAGAAFTICPCLSSCVRIAPSPRSRSESSRSTLARGLSSRKLSRRWRRSQGKLDDPPSMSIHSVFATTRKTLWHVLAQLARRHHERTVTSFFQCRFHGLIPRSWPLDNGIAARCISRINTRRHGGNFQATEKIALGRSLEKAYMMAVGASLITQAQQPLDPTTRIAALLQ